jgi:hypothetical protein
MYISNVSMLWMFPKDAIQTVLLVLIQTRINRIMQPVDTMTTIQVFQLKVFKSDTHKM